MDTALIVPERDAEVVEGEGTTLWLLADASHTGGALGANRIRLDTGVDGAKPHFHAHSHEAYYVLDGTLEMLVDDRVVRLPAGGYLVVPPGVRHAFAAAPGAVADLLVTLTPAVDRYPYFRLLPQIMRNELPPDRLAEIHDRYDVHFVDSPAWTAARSH